MLGHDLFLYPELTARENLMFFARLYGVPDAATRACSALDAANLADRADDRCSASLAACASAWRSSAP